MSLNVKMLIIGLICLLGIIVGGYFADNMNNPTAVGLLVFSGLALVILGLVKLFNSLK